MSAPAPPLLHGIDLAVHYPARGGQIARAVDGVELCIHPAVSSAQLTAPSESSRNVQWNIAFLILIMVVLNIPNMPRRLSKTHKHS